MFATWADARKYLGNPGLVLHEMTFREILGLSVLFGM